MMKKLWMLLLAAVCGSTMQAQPPALYIHIVSHNEPNENLQNALNYNRAKNYALQLAAVVDSKNVRWNLQTSDGFVLGALQDEATTSTNIFKTLSSAPYSDNIEIDPRSKNQNGRNIADQWYLLDSLGANPTHHLGGCIYYTDNDSIQPIDWLQYRNPIIGNVYGNSWQCSIITGAGSYPPHTNDLNDFGIFKPDTTTNFYHHNPDKNLWCMGTGCAPLLDSLADEQAIIDMIQGQVDSIQTGLWPADKFYVTRIMTNQRQYGPMFFQKISKVLDSLTQIPDTQLKWATVSETFAAFQNWQTTSVSDYSQWQCGQVITGTEMTRQPAFVIAPNPCRDKFSIQFDDNENHVVELIDVNGRVLFSGSISNNETITLPPSAAGMMVARIDRKFSKYIMSRQ